MKKLLFEIWALIMAVLVAVFVVGVGTVAVLGVARVIGALIRVGGCFEG